MKTRTTLILLSLIAGSFITTTYVSAQSTDIYVCVDANGKKEYKNTGSTKGCKLLDLPKVATVPSSKVKDSGGKSASVGKTSTPSNFPKVDSGTQKSRDSDRKQIFADELKQEEQKLEAYKKEYNNGEVERRADEKLPHKYIERVNNLKNDIARTEKNIEAIKREISNLK